MKIAKGDALVLVHQRQDIVAAIKAESKKESAGWEEENRKASGADDKQRRGEQAEFERSKFQQQESRSNWCRYRRF